jgi:type I restriction-modification system DNA methylase subunit
MKRDAAIALLDKTLGQPFNESQFRQLVLNLVNELDESKGFSQQGQYIKESFREQVRQYKRIGQYTDPEGCVVDVLVVRLHRPTLLDRARTMQRNFIAKYLQDRDEKEAALVAYYQDDSEDWRFSFVRVDYQIVEAEDGKFKPKKEVTAARRSSFLVGENEPNHTARKQLLDLLLEDKKNPTLEQLEALFQIESVTKEFFEQYKQLFLQLKEELENLVAKDSAIAKDFETHGIDLANFAKKLLGQIVFLYFLQKKGWLGVKPEQGWGTGSRHFLRQLFEGQVVPYQNFFNDLLEPLFYKALAVERGQESLFEPFRCKIPFLNGGLFEPIGGYDWRKTDILIPNETFLKILNTFDLYNFTVREDEPLEKEVAVDPEMLGKVFENLLEVTDRKSKGAFYTPREIVHYMCQESLINYLDAQLNTQTVEIVPKDAKQTSLFSEAQPAQLPLTKQEYCERIPRQDLEVLIRQGEQFIENDEQSLQKERKVAQREQLTTGYQFQVPERVRALAVEVDAALAAVKICDPAIGSGAFPVGMMQEIVKVRGVLTTYLPDALDRTPYDFKRHAIQSSIYGVDIDSGAVDIAKLRLWLSLVVDEEDFESIKPLPNLDYKIVCGNSLLSVEKDLFNQQSVHELRGLQEQYFGETDAKRKVKLKQQIESLIQKLSKNDETFDFEIYFGDVFQQQKGFDIVVGNPPYVRQEKLKDIKDLLKKEFECFVGTADLYVFFYERGLQLLRNHGVLAYITSNKFYRSAYGKKLRSYLTFNSKLHQIIDFGDEKVFEAIAYPTVVVLAKEKTQDNSFNALVWNKEKPIEQFMEVVETQSFSMPQQSLNSNGWQFVDEAALRLLEKLRQSGTPLGEYVEGRFYRGILTGLNEAFVVDRATRDRLIAEHPSSEEVLKPFLRGRDVKRWRIESQDLWLIFIPWHFPLHNDLTIQGASPKAEKTFKENFPAIYNHLLSYKSALSKRNSAETGIRYEWYALQRCAASYWEEFDNPKILYPDIYEKQSFTLDKHRFFAANTCYFIPTSEAWICGLLNSQIVEWFYSKISSSVRGGYLRAFSSYMGQIPIPKSSTGQKQKISALVQKCLDAKGKNVAKFETEIDNFVAKLYDLTPEELALIEGRGKP